MVRRKTEDFEKARVMLGMGYPQAYVVRELGLNKNTVSGWAQKMGYAAWHGDSSRSRRVGNALRRFLRMSAEDREAFFELLRRRKFLPRKAEP